MIGISRNLESDPKKDWWIAESLKKMEYPAVEYLSLVLHNQDKWIRYFAADALGNIGDRRGVDSLIGALHDADLDVRLAATRSLWYIGRHGDVKALNALIAQ